MTDYDEKLKPVLVDLFAKHEFYQGVISELNANGFRTVNNKKFTMATLKNYRCRMGVEIKKPPKKVPVAYVYRITCIHPTKCSGMIYYGKHVNTNPESRGYMGGGELLKLAQRKLGMQYFTKHVIKTYSDVEDAEDAERAEKIIVTTDFVGSMDNFNISIGGLNSTCDGAQWSKVLVSLVIPVL